MPMSQIVVVSNDQVGLATVLHVLNSAGYHATGASTFAEATRAVGTDNPDLVIADERLGEYNGLHVLLRARAEHPDVSAIIATPVASRGLEADARRMNVRCVVKPKNPAEWLKHVSRVLHENHYEKQRIALPLVRQTVLRLGSSSLR